MTMVLEAALPVPAIPQAGQSADAADALEEIIAAHRAALLALAPRQEERAAVVEAGWHITDLGVLLRVRGAATGAAQRTQDPAPGGVRRPERGEENTGTESRPH